MRPALTPPVALLDIEADEDFELDQELEALNARDHVERFIDLGDGNSQARRQRGAE